MHEILSRLIDDFHERDLPDLTRRETAVVEVERKATTIVGMRRAGKTWFCFQRMSDLLESGIPIERLLYINFEDERLLPFTAADFQAILETYFAKLPDFKKQRCYLFLDEPQRIAGWEKFVRRVLDTENVSLWVTGSSSRLLGSEIATALRGRSLSTEIFPFSFREFLSFHGVKLGSPPRFGAQTRARLRKMAERYLAEGGFPEVQSIADAETRRQIHRNYLDVVLLRDVVERYSVANVGALRSLLRHITAAPATRFSINKFYNVLRSRGVRCTKNNLYDYVDYLSDAYLVYPVPIHSRSEKSRQVNPKKLYVIDTGLLSSVSFGMTEDRGALLENLVYTHLRRQGLRPEYYVSKGGTEVDFVLQARGTAERSLIQVCWGLSEPTTRVREVRSLRMAMEELNAKRGTLLTWLDESSEEGIEVMPVWKWLLTEQPF
jgi:predicted AAA+ superfamily ATPase